MNDLNNNDDKYLDAESIIFIMGILGVAGAFYLGSQEDYTSVFDKVFVYLLYCFGISFFGSFPLIGFELILRLLKKITKFNVMILVLIIWMIGLIVFIIR